MRIVYSVLGFALTLLVALFVFTYAALHYRLTMGETMQALKQLQNQIGGQGDLRAVAEIALQGELIAFIAIGILVKLMIELVFSLFGAGDRAISYPRQSGHSPFNRWGREGS